mmetsp:Transcript_33604/g.86046  ORF Transcript_33604/g.86046 Transcript_33604/m.86046 type:complete len:129 (-) Transcript_33604:253-639(-)
MLPTNGGGGNVSLQDSLKQLKGYIEQNKDLLDTTTFSDLQTQIANIESKILNLKEVTEVNPTIIKSIVGLTSDMQKTLNTLKTNVLSKKKESIEKTNPIFLQKLIPKKNNLFGALFVFANKSPPSPRP